VSIVCLFLIHQHFKTLFQCSLHNILPKCLINRRPFKQHRQFVYALFANNVIINDLELQWNSNSVVNKHSIITNRFLGRIVYFGTQINPVITNPEQKWPVPNWSLQQSSTVHNYFAKSISLENQIKKNTIHSASNIMVSWLSQFSLQSL
jgi:hypothetical protein